jgi:PKD repeat protein
MGTATAMLALLTAPAAVAQCPIAATCTPGRASSPNAAAFNMGILNVTLNTINNTTLGQAQGYQDYGCATPSLSTTLLVGQNYTLSVRTNASVGENVRVWIDYNNNGDFIGTTELVLSSNNAMTHTATFAPPASATLGTPLRMRVAADYAQVTVPTSCSTPQYSQVEDYSVTINANANPPVAAFTTNATTTCSGCVQFTDASQNVPTSWSWNFGDGSPVSTVPNPNHCYTTAGTYPVTLTVTNAAGTNTSTATNITYNTTVPVAATCSPATTNYCCNYGVTRFRFGTIDNTSAAGSAGYQDFTCTQRTQLVLGTAYTMTINLGNTSTNQDTRVYLDMNNNGAFDATEKIFEAIGSATPTGTINLPGSVVQNQPLRLRIVSDAGGNNPQPCTSPMSGQVEDYTVVVGPNTSPPVPDFTSNYVPGGCINPVQFTDLSTGAPTSWEWDFGDGSAFSTLQNPSHQYLATGIYTVRLTVTNNIGPASVTKINYLNISVPCLIYCASNGVGATGPTGPQPSPFWITNVAVANAQPSAFTNLTGIEAGGYGNYTGQIISVDPGTATLAVTSNLSFAHRTTVWIDYNQDGVFNNGTELVANGLTMGGPNAGTFTTTFTLPRTAAGTTTRMRIQCLLSNNAPNPCAVNIQNAEVEDYSFQVRPLATRDAQALPSLTLYPNPTLDGRLHLSLGDASAAGTYSATVENLLGATLLRTTVRLTPTAAAELDLSTLAKGVYLLRLRDAQDHTVLRRVVRE